jgi:hypothetical protein
MPHNNRPREYYEADLFGRPGPHPLVSSGAAGTAAPDTNDGSGQPVYRQVWELESALKGWLGQYDRRNWPVILAKLHELRQRSANWPALTAVLPTPFREREVYQAIANVLEQTRRGEQARENGRNLGAAPADTAADDRHTSTALLSEAAADHLRTIAAALISHTTAVQTATHHEFVARMKPRCSGGQTWRDERYLYAQHSPGDDCPAHGRHDNINQRLRVYVGADVAAQTAALEAMANWRAWQKTVDQLAAARRRLADLETALSDFCRYRCPPAKGQPMK